MELACFVSVVFGMKMVSVRNVCVVCGFLMMTIFVRCRSLAMVLRCMFVMFCGFVVML